MHAWVLNLVLAILRDAEALVLAPPGGPPVEVVHERVRLLGEHFDLEVTLKKASGA